MITFQVQVDCDENNVEYVKHRIMGSISSWANARVTYEQNISDWQNRMAEKQEFLAWESGLIDL